MAMIEETDKSKREERERWMAPEISKAVLTPKIINFEKRSQGAREGRLRGRAESREVGGCLSCCESSYALRSGQFAIAHLPNGDAGELHRTVISRCAEHASIETSDGPTGNNAAAVNV
jgi:hypothetical protein